MSQQLRDWAKEALEMLNDNHHLVADNEKHAYVMLHLDVIERGKALLEQPAQVQEPVAWYRDEDGIRIYYDTKCWEDATPLYTTPPAQPAPVQEPDAWVYTRNVHEHIFSWTRWGSGERKGWGETPLYITQPAAHRQWVGLDESEVEDCARGCASNAEFARSVEAKLREKNAPTQGE